MCLLIAYLAGARPDPAALSRAASRNPDGFGWAIVSGGSIISHRTMDASEGVASFVEARSKHLDGPAIWHARIGTHGTIGLDNCHPFPVAGDPLVMLGHNGMLPLSPRCGRSDTRVLADDLLDVVDLDHDGARYWLGQWAAGSKLAILSARPDTASSLYLINEHLGDWSESEPGVWYSNESHAPFVASTFSPDPRRASKSAGVLYDSAGFRRDSLDDLDDLDDLGGPYSVDPDLSPWDYYRAGSDIVECNLCGELWPDFCDWCETCGGDLHGAAVFSGDTLDGVES